MNAAGFYVTSRPCFGDMNKLYQFGSPLFVPEMRMNVPLVTSAAPECCYALCACAELCFPSADYERPLAPN